MKIKTFCSWSGGKDSCLAMYKAIQQGYKIEYLFTMFQEDGSRSRSHGLKPEVMSKYAELLDMKSMCKKATWNDYEQQFKLAMTELEQLGVKAGVFGDIDLEDHRTWVKNACSHTNINVLHPLWQENRRSIIEEFIDLGFKSIIVTVNTDYIPKSYLGKEFTKELINELEALGVDACGENGEFHTAVIDGPIFKKPLNLIINEEIKINNYYMLDLNLGGDE